MSFPLILVISILKEHHSPRHPITMFDWFVNIIRRFKSHIDVIYPLNNISMFMAVVRIFVNVFHVVLMMNEELFWTNILVPMNNEIFEQRLLTMTIPCSSVALIPKNIDGNQLIINVEQWQSTKINGINFIHVFNRLLPPLQAPQQHFRVSSNIRRLTNLTHS